MLRRVTGTRCSSALPSSRRSTLPRAVIPFARPPVVNKPAPFNVCPRRAQHTATPPTMQQQMQRNVKKEEPNATEAPAKSHEQTSKDQGRGMSIVHDEENHRITLVDGANAKAAFLGYEIVRPGLWDLKYTVVAPEHRNHGLAEQLVVRTCELAQSKNVKVICSCSYISDHFMPHHPEWHKIRADTNQSEQQNTDEPNREEQAAKDLNDAMKKTNARGFRGYA